MLHDRTAFVVRSYDVDRVAVVTGGASGIGRAVSEHLARRGHRVAVLDLDGDAAATAAAGIGAAMAGEVDVADRAAVDSAFEAVRQELGPIEILVTSAAVSGFVAFEDLTAADWY